MTATDKTTTTEGPWLILEVPHRGDPTVWMAHDQADFIERLSYDADRKGVMVYEATTYRSIAEDWDLESDGDDFPELRSLVTHGLDTPLYRADCLTGEGVYSTDPVDELDAWKAYAGRDKSGWWLIRSQAECRTLLADLVGPNAPRVGQCGPLHAAAALCRQARDIGWSVVSESEFLASLKIED